MPESMKKKLDNLVKALVAYQEGPKEKESVPPTPAPVVPPGGTRYEPSPATTRR